MGIKRVWLSRTDMSVNVSRPLRQRFMKYGAVVLQLSVLSEYRAKFKERAFLFLSNKSGIFTFKRE